MKKREKFNLKFSILMPVYNGARVIFPTLQNILNQSFNNFELIIVDDCSRDNTEKVVKSFKDKRIKFFKNKKNLGYPGNLEECCKKATGDILYLMGQDDILGKDALLNTYKVFKEDENVGAVTRPYFWFDDKINFPVRAKKQLNPDKDEIVTIDDDLERIIAVFETLDQVSGLAMRRKFIDIPFGKEIFTSHIYPFASIFKKHPVVFLRDYCLAVRMSSSMSRTVSSVYNKSPMESWAEMFETVFFEKKFDKIRKDCIKNFIAVNYIGLVQLRNYAKFRYLLREIYLLLKYRWENIFSLHFWVFSLGCLLMPPFLLIPLVSWYKRKINSKRFSGIKFHYKI